eukprot:TRINITY_DN21097_c0_g1_i1.p1 TRINITY_DN21097_c0_g1~~TRINITY_DN21097_c0_g1_i1.p1  ORF type:complete len:479 (+),score=146.36 TRINITY_DN21097_c0_g1_i1:190-1626(+)
MMQSALKLAGAANGGCVPLTPSSWVVPQGDNASDALMEFLNELPGDIVGRFWGRFLAAGVTDLHTLSKLSSVQLRELVPPLGPYKHLYAELQKDWHCAKCGFINYSRYGNAECYRCSYHRTVSHNNNVILTSKDADTNRISALLHEREQTRRAQDFERADAIREQLRAIGVVWDDDMKTWRTPDGRCGRWGTPSHAAAAAGAAQGGYCIKLRGLPFRIRYDDIRNFFALAGIEILQYSVVLEKNADGRPSGVGYVKVATPQEQQQACAQLNHKHIPGYDRYAWVVESSEAEYQAAKNSWAGAILTEGPIEGDALETSQVLKEREECRKLKQYERADIIRETLKGQGITFDDELRTWTDKNGNSGRWGMKTPCRPLGLAQIELPADQSEEPLSEVSWPTSKEAEDEESPLLFGNIFSPPTEPIAPPRRDEEEDDVSQMLSEYTDSYDACYPGSPALQDAPLVTRLQSILCAVAQSPTSP